MAKTTRSTKRAADTPSSGPARYVTVYVAGKATPQKRLATFVSVETIRRSAGLGKKATQEVRARLLRLGILKKETK